MTPDLDARRAPIHAAPRRRGEVAFWALAVAAGPPTAWLAARFGFGLPVRSPMADLLVLALWSVSEEVVFRGALQPWLAARFRHWRSARGGRDRAFAGISRANAVTSLWFSLAHLPQHTAVAATAVFPVSLVLGLARERSGRLWPSVLLHLYYNGLLYAASALPIAGRVA